MSGERENMRGPAARVLAIGALVLLLLALNPVAVTAADRSAPTAADAFAEATGAPGVAVAEIDLHDPDPGQRTRISVAGTDGAGRPITADTAFVWGSVSKPVMAAVIAELGIPREAKVGALLPELADTDLARHGTTVGDLLVHTSGLPHDLEATDIERRTSAADVVTAADSPVRIPLGEPGPDGAHAYRYSSLNYLLLQAIAERDGDIDAAFRTVVPGVLTSPERGGTQVPPGTVPFLGGDRLVAAGYDRAGLGYGYLAGSATTLADFVAAQLQSPPHRPTGQWLAASNHR